MTEKLEHIGVDVWMCGTIYVEAPSDEEAAQIVAQRYAGTLAKPDTYDHLDGEDLPLDGDDFQSSAVTLYGLANQAELVPANDPLRKSAPALLAALKLAEKHIDNVCGETSQADLPDWFANLKTIRAVITKAEGGANG